jgi:hypothetical protein
MQYTCRTLATVMKTWIIEVSDNQDLARASTSKPFLNPEEDSVLNSHVLTFTFYRQLCIAICVQKLQSTTKIPRSLFSSSHPITTHLLIFHLQFAMRLLNAGSCQPRIPRYVPVSRKPSPRATIPKTSWRDGFNIFLQMLACNKLWFGFSKTGYRPIPTEHCRKT